MVPGEESLEYGQWFDSHGSLSRDPSFSLEKAKLRLLTMTFGKAILEAS